MASSSSMSTREAMARMDAAMDDQVAAASDFADQIDMGAAIMKRPARRNRGYWGQPPMDAITMQSSQFARNALRPSTRPYTRIQAERSCQHVQRQTAADEHGRAEFLEVMRMVQRGIPGRAAIRSDATISSSTAF